MKLRVFVDSIALFSAITSSTGSARDLDRAANRRRVEFVVSDYVIGEVHRNLAKSSDGALQTLGIVLTTSIVSRAEPDADTIERVALVVDPKDAPIIAAAIAAKAPIVTTYDQRHLLSPAEELRAAFGVEVLTPRDVLERMASDG